MEEQSTFGFGERLRAAREKAGLTQTQLASIAGENGGSASKQAVAGWEKERHYPKANQLRAICLKLSLSPDDLLLGDIKDNLKFLRAESAMLALTPEQRVDLIASLAKTAATNERVGKFISPAPRHELDSGFGALSLGDYGFDKMKQGESKK